MLWQNYILRSADGVHELWDDLYSNRSTSFIYISGKGFDTRGCAVLRKFLNNLRNSDATVESAELLLIDFAEYELEEDLEELTAKNQESITQIFKEFGKPEYIEIGKLASTEDDLNSSIALKEGVKSLTRRIKGQTDIILDISSLPRVVYLSVMAGILRKLVTDFENVDSLAANDVNFQVLVAEDTILDSKILSLEPSKEIVYVPGFSSALHAESMTSWPVVWFPILGENRLPQFDIVKAEVDSTTLEICPVLPHPSKDFRRGDNLLREYRRSLFDDKQATPTSNILYAHESNPFEAYRQIHQAIERYVTSMSILDGCRIAVTPFSSKLITLGAGLACLEQHMISKSDASQNFIVTVPYAEPTRYSVPKHLVEDAQPEISSLLLTGSAYVR